MRSDITHLGGLTLFYRDATAHHFEKLVKTGVIKLWSPSESHAKSAAAVVQSVSERVLPDLMHAITQSQASLASNIVKAILPQLQATIASSVHAEVTSAIARQFSSLHQLNHGTPHGSLPSSHANSPSPHISPLASPIMGVGTRQPQVLSQPLLSDGAPLIQP